MIKFAAELRIKAGKRNFEGDDQYVINLCLAITGGNFSIFRFLPCRWISTVRVVF
jgi:hypothetical protein